MASDTKTYDGVTRQALDKLRAGLQKAHVALPPGDSGDISSNGLAGSFAYDEEARTLELTIEKYPMFIPKGIVWGAIDGAIVDAKRT
jgi:hypothetical protein